MHIYDLALETASRVRDVAISKHSWHLVDCQFLFWVRKAFIMLDNEKWKFFTFATLTNGPRMGRENDQKWGRLADCWAYGPVLAIIKVYASVLDLIKNKKNENGNAKLFDCQMRASRLSGFARDIYYYYYFCFKFVYVN